LIGLPVSFAFQLPPALGADGFVAEMSHAFAATAENTAGLVLAENDAVLFHKDLYRVAYLQTKSPPQIHRQHNTAQFVNAPHDTC